MTPPQLYGNPEIHTANLQESERPTDKQCFDAIDAWVREKEREWVAVARACLEVQGRELWKHGGYHSWDAWLNSAAPSSARTIYWHIRIVRGLEADFTDEELATIPPESAKVLSKVSPSVRRDPRVREAAKSKKRHLVETVQETHPDQHIETDVKRVLNFTESQWAVVSEMIEAYRVMNNPETPEAAILEELAAEWLNAPWEDSPYSNRERAQQLRV